MHVSKDIKLSFLISAGLHACFLSFFLFAWGRGLSKPAEKPLTFTKVSLKSSNDSSIKPLLSKINERRKALPKFNIALNNGAESFRDFNTGPKRNISKSKTNTALVQKNGNKTSFDFDIENTQNPEDSLLSYTKKPKASNMKNTSKPAAKAVFKNKSSETSARFSGNNTNNVNPSADVFETSYNDTGTGGSLDISDISAQTPGSAPKAGLNSIKGKESILSANAVDNNNSYAPSDSDFFDLNDALASSKDNNSENSYGYTAIETSKDDGIGIKIIGEISKRKIIKHSIPEYPKWLSKKRIEPSVTLAFSVLPDGRVKDTVIVKRSSGYVELDNLSIKELKKWLFSPINSEKLFKEEKGEITYKFSLR